MIPTGIARWLIAMWLLFGGGDALRDVVAAESYASFKRREPHMGTEFTLVVYALSEQEAEAGFRAAFARIAELDQRLSNYKTESELNALCAGSPHSHSVPVSDDLWKVLQKADEVSRKSDGSFDVSVGPLTRLWRQARRTQAWPEAAKLEKARAAVGFERIVFDEKNRAVQLTRADMQLDLGGIAKGYALDEALRALKERGLDQALVEGGGDIRVGRSPVGEPSWSVSIAGLHDRDTETVMLNLRETAVATSGDLFQFFEYQGKRYSHLIDPRTGIGLTRQSSATVVAADGITADAWASALLVMGPELGMKRVAEVPGLEARFVWQDGNQTRVEETAGFIRLRKAN